MSAEQPYNNDDDIPKPDIDESIEESCYRFPNYTYISPNKLALLIEDPISHSYDIIRILDARFEYEYKGGKIVSARNVTSYSALFKIFNNLLDDVENGKSVCIVFHCEFSSVRGPTLYDLFRNLDRQYNYDNYPKITFPNLFLLEGGFNKFYETHREHCIGEYVKMDDEQFNDKKLICSCPKKYFSDYNDFLDEEKHQFSRLSSQCILRFLKDYKPQS